MVNLKEGKEAMGGKSRNWEKKRQKLLSTAARLFWQKGYLGTSTDDIAAAAKVNKATIYYYFKNKSQILYEAMSAAALEFYDIAEPLANSELPPMKKLEKLITEFITSEATRMGGFAGIAQQEKRNLPPKLARDYVELRDRVEAVFRKVVMEVITENRSQWADPKLPSLFILGILNSIIQWYKPGGELSGEEIAAEVYRFISATFQPPDSSGSCLPVTQSK